MLSERSIHLKKFPDVKLIPKDSVWMNRMEIARIICNAVLFIRNDVNIKVKTPLQTIFVYSEGFLDLEECTEVIKEETNVKSIKFIDKIDQVAKKKVVLNLRSCGKKFGSETRNIMHLANEGSWKIDNEGNLLIKNFVLTKEDFTVRLEPVNNSNKNIRYQMLNLPKSHSISSAFIGLDITLTSELKEEGCFREIVREVQNDRKSMNLFVSDEIKIKIFSDSDKIKSLLKREDFRKCLISQVLAIDSFFECSKLSNLKNIEGSCGSFDHRIEGLGDFKVVFFK